MNRLIPPQTARYCRRYSLCQVCARCCAEHLYVTPCADHRCGQLVLCLWVVALLGGWWGAGDGNIAVMHVWCEHQDSTCRVHGACGRCVLLLSLDFCMYLKTCWYHVSCASLRDIRCILIIPTLTLVAFGNLKYNKFYFVPPLEPQGHGLHIGREV